MSTISYPEKQSKKSAFHCPSCKAYAQQLMFVIKDPHSSAGVYHFTYYDDDVILYVCEHCKNSSFWTGKNIENMIFPDVSNSPHPNDDMPNNIKKNYDEAASITNKSPRSAAALIQLALEELCKYLECKGNNLYENINFLIKENKLPLIQKATDAVRILGNAAVHPISGIIDLQDNMKVEKIFELINFIVEKTIGEPKKIESIYGSLPDSKKRKGNQ